MTILISGIVLGSVYALVALSNNITLAQSGLFNFAQAQYVVLGAFLAYAGVGQLGLPILLVVPCAAVLLGALGYVQYRLTVRPLGANAQSASLVTTVGVSVVVEGVILAIWGAEPRTFASPFGASAVELGGARVLISDIVIVGTAVAAALVLHVVSRRTRWGLSGRAATADSAAAQARGIDVGRLDASAFVLAGALSGVFGAVIAPKTGVMETLGASLLIFGFVGLAIGGFGSYLGGLVGSLVVGLVSSYGARYLGVEWPPIILAACLLLVLLVRPTGLFGDRSLRTV